MGVARAVPADVAAELDRSTTPQRVAELLRDRILDGRLRSGTQCAEVALTAAFGVSRNTLREAFQVLIADNLLERSPHRGVFVRQLDAADVRDIYAMRRLVECAALAAPPARAGGAAPRAAEALHAAAEAGRAAAARGDWHEAGSADVRFHLAVVAAAGSERLDRAMRGVAAELRLAFQLIADPRALHEPFVDRNGELAALVAAGRRSEAAAAMGHYLDDAERVLLTALGVR